MDLELQLQSLVLKVITAQQVQQQAHQLIIKLLLDLILTILVLLVSMITNHVALDSTVQRVQLVQLNVLLELTQLSFVPLLVLHALLAIIVTWYKCQLRKPVQLGFIQVQVLLHALDVLKAIIDINKQLLRLQC